MDFDLKLSCEGFPSDMSTSSKSGIVTPTAVHKKCRPVEPELDAMLVPPECSDILPTSSSTSSSMSTAYMKSECRLHTVVRKPPPNISYEVAIAKSILQQYSTLSGDNLFDHLSDIVKRVIDERPPNIIDFFEEFSRNVREQKFHLPERFPLNAIYEESRMYRVAKRQLLSMKLPSNEDSPDFGPGLDEEEETKSIKSFQMKLDIFDTIKRFVTFNERVQQLQFYWNQCGFSISSDDVFQLACSMDRLQTHPSIYQCRFWGVINGLKASYYIVEASLTLEELAVRRDQMEAEILEKQGKEELCKCYGKDTAPLPTYIGPELTPGGYGWENYPSSEIAKMKPQADPIPLIKEIETFDIPPETVGLGLNRYSYFVVNALSDDWIELPIVTPKQIAISRHIKKFLTGDLEAEIVSYPCFPGKEKHYLRAMISRITAGTHIAPAGYYRKMTPRELRQYLGLEDDEMEEEEEEPVMGENEEEDLDNDVILLKNEKYDMLPLPILAPIANWVHVRPYILDQGRIVWFDEDKARREREKSLARCLKQRLLDEMEEEEEEEEEEGEEEGEEEELLEGFSKREIGPPILHPCDFDVSSEFTVPWIARLTSEFTNKNERVLIMHSNTWPGAFTFTFEKLCESIYMGWGHKYTSRNIAFKHLPPIVYEYPHGSEDFIESADPTVEEEEAYRLRHLKKEKIVDDIAEQISDFDDNEYSHDSEDSDRD